mmetsp:Transcript_8587/g.14461  ORF Transcript_8587/g.14461 Transcript_8587/m.14461 type:complete len:91 (+) Transcript_8587:537-809(+)
MAGPASLLPSGPCSTNVSSTSPIDPGRRLLSAQHKRVGTATPEAPTSPPPTNNSTTRRGFAQPGQVLTYAAVISLIGSGLSPEQGRSDMG